MSTTLAPAARAAPLVDRARWRIEVRGVVQGVGFRPFVYVAATELGLTGGVSNSSAGVQIDAEGERAALVVLVERLSKDHPPLARVDEVVVTELVESGGTGFEIRESSHGGAGRTLASPDVATCEACVAEMADPTNRRYRHAFISCTNCGPRFTIIRDLPYDRPLTTMAGFEMCEACAAEYADPLDRRFHAQTIACRSCGPRLSLLEGDRTRARDDDAIARARRMLADGAILAVKGIGGYHLVCDATSERVVGELRRRKQRGDKPFAVMVADLGVARRHAEIGDQEAALLQSAARPIVLVRRRDGSTGVSASVAPGVADIGLLLAYTPLHTLLFGLPGDDPSPDALVATSGNLSGEPIVARDDAAIERLAPLVDAWLTHDRQIHVPCDDSVLRVVDDEHLPLRRARGYAPMPVTLPLESAPALSTGADLKNTCCLASGRRAWVSQHVGDMDDLETLRAFDVTEALMRSITGVEPTELACDAHPGYRSSAWARRRAGDRRVTTVQHHHAHVASLLAEHEVEPDTEVIGFAFDGTGYGTDGAIWGGEVLVCNARGFERFAHLAYVALPGGDAAVERPYRMALSHLRSASVPWAPDLKPVAACASREREVLARQLDTGLGCAPTSSMGRLFDAVSSLCGVRHVAEYEAQAAMELESLARLAPKDAWDAPHYRFEVAAATTTGPLVADAAPVIRAIVADLRRGVGPPEVSVRFHGAVVALVCELAERAREGRGLNLAGLTGGVFQNPVLLARVSAALKEHGFGVLRHRVMPPNDGGISLGQLLVAAGSHGQNGGAPCA